MLESLSREWISSSTLFDLFYYHPTTIVRLRSQTNADWQNPVLELWLDPNGRPRDIWAKPGPLISCPTRSSQTQMVFSCPLTPPWLPCSSQRTRLDHLEWPHLCNSWLRFKRLVPPHALISSQGLVGPWCNRNRRVSQSMKWYKSEKVKPTHEVNVFYIWQMCCFAV